MLDSPPGSPSSQDLSLSYPSVGIVFPPYSPSDPLPEYTRAWGTHLRRPDSLPPNYDTRIDPAHIFLFSVHPITGIKRDFYVTPKPCEYCAKIRQVCSRTRPLCHRCAVSGDNTRICSVEEGWVKLPGPKCEKPRLQKRVSDMRNPRASSETEDSPPPKKARYIAPSPGELDGDSSLRSTPVPTPAPQVKKPPPKKIVQTKGDATGKVSGRRGKRWKGPEAEKAREDGRWVARDGTVWSPIKPPQRPALPSKPKGFDRLLHDEPQKATPPNRPRIWATSQAELLEVLPEISRALGPQGSSVYTGGTGIEPPLWFLEDSAWPEDGLKDDGSASLTLCEEIFSPPQKEQPPADRVLRRREQASTPSSKDVNPTPSPASALLPPSNPPPRPPVQEQITNPCHPSQAMQSRQTVFRVDPPPVPFLRLAPAHIDVPSTPQTLQVPASGSQFITFTRAPSKSPLPPPGPHVMPGITGRFNSRAEPPRPTLSRVGPPELPAPIPPWDSRARPAPPSDTFLGYTLPCDFGQQRGAARQPLQQRFMVSEEVGTQDGRSSSSLGSRIAQLRPAAFSPEHSPTSDNSQDSEDIVPLSPDRPRPPLPPFHNGSSISYLERNAYKPSLKVVTSDVQPPPASRPNGTPRPADPEDTAPAPIPEDQPPEIRSLADCERHKIPVVLVVFRESPLLPFALPADVSIAFLGLFRILSMVCTTESSSVDDDGWRVTRARWHFKLRWVPGGENTRRIQPERPWWQPQVQPTGVELSPYVILPPQLRTDFDRTADEIASEVTTRKGWHCTQCGRLNVQRLLCYQECDTPGCKGVNPVLPVAAFYVRDPHKMTPDVRPMNTYPEGVMFDVLDGKANGYRTFVYTIGEGVEIKHIFTCNRPMLQKPFNELFVDIQREVKLTWQGGQTKLAAGPYFTYAAGRPLEDDQPIDRWPDAPESIRQTRWSIQNKVNGYAKLEDFSVDHLTVLAWQTPGTRKGAAPLRCKQQAVAIMCLGADVELTIVPTSGYPFAPHNERSGGNGRAARRRSRGEDGWSNSDSNSDSEDDEPLAASMLKKRKSKKAARESMLFTLVHGDVVVLSGDDFEYTIHRTGMSIVFFGLPVGPTSS